MSAYPLVQCCSAKQTDNSLVSLHVHLSIFAFLWKFAVGKLWCNDLNTECSSANQTNNTLASLHVYLRRVSSSVTSSTLSAWPVAQRNSANQTDSTLVSLHDFYAYLPYIQACSWQRLFHRSTCSALNAWPVAQRCPAKQTDDTLVSLHVHICIYASLLLWANSGAIQHCSSLSAWPVAQLLCKTDRQHHLCPCMHTSAYLLCIRACSGQNLLLWLRQALCNWIIS